MPSFSGIGNWEIKDQDWRNSKQGINNSITALQQTVASFGSYTTANGTGADNHPDVTEPNTKTIYLVKDSSITSGDAYGILYNTNFKQDAGLRWFTY